MHTNHPLWSERPGRMPKAAKQKYYAVKIGREGPKIYTTWQEVLTVRCDTSVLALTTLAFLPGKPKCTWVLSSQPMIDV